MAKAFSSIGFGIVAGAAVAATAFLAGVRLPGSGSTESSAQADASAIGPLAELSTRIRAGDSADGNPIAGLVQLARRDHAAALAALAQIDDPRSRRDAALALLEEFGGDLEGIDRIAAALPPVERLNFTFDAIALSAAGDPQGAIAMALALENPAAQTEAIARIAMALAAVDPRAALGNVAAIANYAHADTFRNAVLEEWSSLDPDGFFDFLENAGPRDIPARSDVFRIAASSDPERLLALVRGLPRNLQSAAELAAFEALVRIDPAFAFATIDAMPAGSAQVRLLQGTARSFAMHDLEAALAWLGARPSAGSGEVSAVLDVLAQTDPVRAVDLLIANVARTGNSSAFTNALNGFTPGPREALAIVADRLSGADDAAIQIAFGQFMDLWTRNDSEAAVEWAFAHPDRLSSEAIQGLAMNLATANPELAKQAVTRLPPDKQSQWMRVVAQQLGRDDVDDALQWLARYEGQSFYEGAVQAALMGVSINEGRGDPRSLAAFVERQSPQLRADTAPEAAYFWAASDPRAAAQWAERVDLGSADASRRRAVLSNVAGQWALREPDAARDWVLGLPQGTGRDQVLSSLLRATVATGRIDTRVVDSYSSDESRRQFLLGLMPALGVNNPELGRTLIDRYFDDPETRTQAEQRLIDGVSNPSAAAASGAVMYN